MLIDDCTRLWLLVVAPEAADVDTPDDGDAPRPIDETLAGDGAPYGYTLCGLAA